jgi:RNA polymerase-binding transcription factor DksA
VTREEDRVAGDPLEQLRAAHGAAREQVAALQVARDEIVAASEGSNADDEHDPEGATIAFERQQVRALLTQAEASLAAVESALEAHADGSYGRCERCGAAIGAERLEALPAVATCISCARALHRG